MNNSSCYNFRLSFTYDFQALLNIICKLHSIFDERLITVSTLESLVESYNNINYHSCIGIFTVSFRTFCLKNANVHVCKCILLWNGNRSSYFN